MPRATRLGMTFALVALLLTSAPDTPRARLLEESARITADMPSIHFSGAMASTGFTLFAGGTTIALLAGFGGTGDVVAMAFFLIGIPSVVAAVGLALVIVGVIKFARVIRTRSEELRLEDAPKRLPNGVEVLTF